MPNSLPMSTTNFQVTSNMPNSLPMKESTFYRKFANMPPPRRAISVTLGADQNGNMRSTSPHEVYLELNRLTDIRRINDQAIKDLLVIAEKITH